MQTSSYLQQSILCDPYISVSLVIKNPTEIIGQMSTVVRLAVVTGANKGIGLAIVRSLCKQFTGDVYLTARDEGRGQAAVALLNAEGLNPKFHQLDITSQESIDTLKKFVLEKYGGIDVLVNNAGAL